MRAARTAFGPQAELLVVDGGSRDGTTELITDDVRLLACAPGRARQLNAGARAALGNLLVFLHADTWPPADARAVLERALADADIVGGCFRVDLRGPSARRPLARLLAAGINLRSRWLRTATGDQTIFARRAAFTALGGYPDVQLFEDVLFFRRLRGAGRVVLLQATVRTSDRRWRARGYLRTMLGHWLLRLLFWVGVSPARLAALYRRRV